MTEAGKGKTKKFGHNAMTKKHSSPHAKIIETNSPATSTQKKETVQPTAKANDAREKLQIYAR